MQGPGLTGAPWLAASVGLTRPGRSEPKARQLTRFVTDHPSGSRLTSASGYIPRHRLSDRPGSRQFFANPRHALIFDRRRVQRRRIKMPVALDQRRRNRRTGFEIDQTIRVQGWAVVPMRHPQEADLPDEGEILQMERRPSSSGREMCTCGARARSPQPHHQTRASQRTVPDSRVRLSALRQGYTASPVGRLILFCPKEQQLHQRSPPAVARESGSV